MIRTMKTMGTALLLLFWISCSFDSVARGVLVDRDSLRSGEEACFIKARSKVPVAHFEQFRAKDSLSVRKSSSLRLLCGAQGGEILLAIPAFAGAYLYSCSITPRENWQFLLRAAALPRAPSTSLMVLL